MATILNIWYTHTRAHLHTRDLISLLKFTVWGLRQKIFEERQCM